MRLRSSPAALATRLQLGRDLPSKLQDALYPRRLVGTARSRAQRARYRLGLRSWGISAPKRLARRLRGSGGGCPVRHDRSGRGGAIGHSLGRNSRRREWLCRLHHRWLRASSPDGPLCQTADAAARKIGDREQQQRLQVSVVIALNSAAPLLTHRAARFARRRGRRQTIPPAIGTQTLSARTRSSDKPGIPCVRPLLARVHSALTLNSMHQFRALFSSVVFGTKRGRETQ